MRAFRVYENFVHLFYICVISQRQTPEEETMTASELEDTEHCGRISLSRLVKELSDRAIQKTNKKQITALDS